MAKNGKKLYEHNVLTEATRDIRDPVRYDLKGGGWLEVRPAEHDDGIEVRFGGNVMSTQLLVLPRVANVVVLKAAD